MKRMIALLGVCGSFVARADSIEADAGAASLSLYGNSVAGVSRRSGVAIVRVEKAVSGELGAAGEFRSTFDNAFRGLSLGFTYDFASALLGSNVVEATGEPGVRIDRFPFWRIRGIAMGGRWSFSGVVRGDASTRYRNKALSVDLYGVSLGTVVSRNLTPSLDLHVGAGWLAGFAPSFGAQQLAASAGLGWRIQ